jgi:putative transposase
MPCSDSRGSPSGGCALGSTSSASSPVTRSRTAATSKLKVNLSTVIAGQLVGIREVEGQVWLVSFLDYDLGFF